MRVGKPEGGVFLQLFEKEVTATFGCEYAVAVNSATSGLHLALRAIGIGAGNTVAVPAITMTASAAAIYHAGAKHVLVDVNPFSGIPITDNWVEMYEESNPDAAVVVHLFGQVDDIADNASGMQVIEDCAQAPGCVGSLGEFAGLMGEIGVLSLNQDKVMSCGEGGVCITNSFDHYQRLLLLRNHGENHADIIGYNYRMTELQAAVAYYEIQHLFERQKNRLRWSSKLIEMLQDQERYAPQNIENPPYQVYLIDNDHHAAGSPPGWRRGYSRPLCCIPGLRSRSDQGCLVGAHQFNARVICTNPPESEEEAGKLAKSVLSTV